MKSNVVQKGGYSVVSLAGEVDLYYSPKVRDQILKQLHSDNNVLVDLSAVEYIDSSGIASLVEGLQIAKSRNLEFGLVGVSEPAMQVLELARLDKVFPIYSSLGEKLDSGV